jgi:ribose/xylose/arabinose/galactoside ABC-type transport system permease subunit
MSQGLAMPKRKWYQSQQALGLLEKLLSNSLLAATVVVIIIYAILGRDMHYFTFENLVNILLSLTTLGFLTWSMSVAMLAGNIDWSTAGIAAIASLTVGVLFMQKGVEAIPAILITLVVCMAFSLISSFLIVNLKIPSLVATIAVNGSFIASAMFISNNTTINIRLPGLADTLVNFNILRIPFIVWLMFLFFGIAYVMLNHTRLGAHIYAIGANPAAARLNGVKVSNVIRITLMWSAVCVGMAGIIMTVRGGITQLYGSQITITPAFTPVMLGGISIFGGRGRLENMLVAIIFITVLNNGLYMMNAQIGVVTLANGLVLLIALVMSSLRDYIAKLKA